MSGSCQDMTADPSPLLQATDLGRRFGYRNIFKNVDLGLSTGDGVLVLGPNGTGKTTLLRVLAGLLSPSSGAVTHHGSVDLVGHQSMTYDALSARENLSFFSRLLGPEPPGRVEAILNTVGLIDFADQPVGPFSRGMRQRLALGRVLLGEPKVLLLDEPFSGLDSDGVLMVSGLVNTWRTEGRAVVVVSHDIPRSAPLCSSLVVLTRGIAVGPENIGSDAAKVAERYAEVVADG